MTDFPIHAGLPKRYGGALPAAADVVVIGGGIIGVMTAWYLAERGQSVVLCEKGRIAGEQSSRNWGWIRQQGRDFAELPIMMESLALWQQIADEMPEIGFRSSGTMYLARSHEEMFGFENWATEARGMGLDVRMQSTTQVYGRYDRAAVLWVGGLFTESDACADPWVAVPMMAEGAVRRGVTIFEDCAVRRLERAGGRVSGVVTELGTVGCDQVVVAGGAWSSLFLQAEGVRIPQLSVLASVAQTVALPEVVEGCMRDGRIGITRRRDGGYSIAPRGTHDFFLGPDAFRAVGKYLPELRRDFRSTQFRLAAPKNYPDAWRTRRTWAGDEVSPFERMRVLNPAPNLKMLKRAQEDFSAAFPEIGRPEIKSAWAGMIDTTPDVLPVLDRVASLPGLVIATGMCGHGFGIGPGIGRVVADLVVGGEVEHDLSRFRLSRFSDGSKLVPGLTI